ncbi:MAG: hypothetical protein HY741_25920 [Chloroflexi bacterium]|nr:hypothetical protein [Chloroflexota bacterium]
MDTLTSAATLTPTPTATLGAAQSVTIDYEYDPLYRLTNAVYSGDITTTIGYSYDEVGNRLAQDIDGVVTNYAYDNANRLVQVTSPTSQVTNFGWDNNGNLLSDGVNTYTYDQANRLVSVMRCNHRRNPSPVTSFAYNGLGDRLRQTVGGVTTTYVNDYAAGLTQVLSDGTNTYLYGAGRIGQYQTAMQFLQFFRTRLWRGWSGQC